MRRRIQQRICVSVHHMVTHTLTPDLSQVELLAGHILEAFKNVEPGGRSAVA